MNGARKLFGVVAISLTVMGAHAQGCATTSAVDDPVTLQFLESEQNTLRTRLETLEDQRSREQAHHQRRAEALERAREARPWLVEQGDRPYLVIHADYIRRGIEAFLPAHHTHDGFQFVFREMVIERAREEMVFRISFQVRSRHFDGPKNALLRGSLTVALVPQLNPAGSWIDIVAHPREMVLDDRSIRNARLLEERVPLDQLRQLIPPVPIPLLPGDTFRMGELSHRLDLVFDLDSYLVVYERIVIPFTLEQTKR